MEAVALHNFKPEQEDELHFRKGAILTILKDSVEKNWCQAKLWKKTGLVPKNFIRFKAIPGCSRSISRNEAEDFLSKQPDNHSYLVRESQSASDEFSISVKHDEEVRHFKILTDDERRYYVLDRRFSSINDLIEHHKTHSLNRTENIVLSYPIAMEVKTTVTLRAKSTTDLSFTKGEMITVTDYSDKNWWAGSIDDRFGIFPASYVVPMDFPL